MAGQSFPFTASALHGLRLQSKWLEWGDWRRVVAWCGRSHRDPTEAPARLTRPHHRCCDTAVHSALFTGDLWRVQALFPDKEAANMGVETVSHQLAWSAEQGFWVMTPKTKQTAPLALAAARGYTDCARHLILQGTELDAPVGGQAALHEACAHSQPNCVRLLLAFGARANVLSEEGAALHLCPTPKSQECAKLLLDAGAALNLAAGDEATLLHVAAASGLEAHVALYLARGALVELRTGRRETALNVACAGAEPGAVGLHEAAVRRLLEARADPRVAGRKRHSPLRHAWAHGHSHLAELLLLLRHGARSGAPNAAGLVPLDCLLQAASNATELEVLLAALQDRGAGPTHPEMLKHCANLSRALEVLLNAYPCMPSCDTWVQAVLPEWQEHETFYSSALRMVNQPRLLQHLARLAVRAQLGDCCCEAATQLPLPPVLQDYLLLHVEGHIE
ncbi:LOW QUALITY PROTEIN: ankyrin repeat and SOCS box protein 16 [Erethizon dorsatum]